MRDDLAERFAALDADVTRNAPVATAARVRARGDRRRVGLATTSIAAVGALSAIGALGAVTVAGRGPDVVESPPSGTIPAALRLPHEGEAGWQIVADGTELKLFSGCMAADPVLTGRLDARTATGPGHPGEEGRSPTRVTEHLALFYSDMAAEAAIQDLAATVQACSWVGPGMSMPLDGTLKTGEYPNAELNRITGFRVGNAIFVVVTTTRGALQSSVGGDEHSLMALRLCTHLRLCAAVPGVSPMAAEPSGSQPRDLSPEPFGSYGSYGPSLPGPGGFGGPGSPLPSGSGDPGGPGGPSGSVVPAEQGS